MIIPLCVHSLVLVMAGKHILIMPSALKEAASGVETLTRTTVSARVICLAQAQSLSHCLDINQCRSLAPRVFREDDSRRFLGKG